MLLLKWHLKRHNRDIFFDVTFNTPTLFPSASSPSLIATTSFSTSRKNNFFHSCEVNRYLWIHSSPSYSRFPRNIEPAFPDSKRTLLSPPLHSFLSSSQLSSLQLSSQLSYSLSIRTRELTSSSSFLIFFSTFLASSSLPCGSSSSILWDDHHHRLINHSLF